MRADKVAHELNALLVVKNDNAHAELPENVLRPEEVPIFSNHNAWNPIEQGCSSTHDAGTQRADQGQIRPIAAPAGVADAHYFRMRGGIARLHALVMTAGYDSTLAVDQNRTDRQTSL